MSNTLRLQLHTLVRKVIFKRFAVKSDETPLGEVDHKIFKKLGISLTCDPAHKN